MDQTELQAEYATLALPAFDELSALRLGQILVDLALAEDLPVVIDIRTPDRTLFHAALPGSAPLNDIWARRKSNTALIFQLPSLLVGRRNAANGETLTRHGLSAEDHAEAGGAVPIRVAGVGVVAVATVSGLPQVEDHRLVVRGIRALIERGREA
ncbi:MAG: heme-degrading domain-containing protein [Tabrizicola sp.]